MNKSKVSIQQCSDYDPKKVEDGLSILLEPFGGMQSYVSKGERVLIKPNLLKPTPPEKAVTTHPALVEAVVKEVQNAGGMPVIGDSPGIGNMKKIFDISGMTQVAHNTGASLVEFVESVDVKANGDSHFKSIEISKDVMDADKVINLPKVKTHVQMHLTLGVKNCFGCVVGKRKPQWHFKAGVTREHFAALILDIYNIVNPDLTIADGIVGMEGNGPGSGNPKDIGLLFASPDAIAMDSVITEILGFKSNDVPVLKIANKRGHSTHINDIELIGPEISEIMAEAFEGPKSIDVMFGPPFMKKYLKKALTAKPFIDNKLCTLCRQCISTCPTKVMSLRDAKVKINYDDCIDCFCCQEICPEGAISPKQGWLLRLVGKKG